MNRTAKYLCALLCSLAAGFNSASADELTQQRFAMELTRSLVGTYAEFVPVGDGQGARGFLLAQIGSTAAPISEAYSGLQGEFTQTLADVAVFDKPVAAARGVAVLRGDNLANVWRDILDKSRPGFSLGRDRALDERTMKWLFRRNPGKTEPSQRYSREPSPYYERYLEFQERYALLMAAQRNDVWRAIPAFSRYKTFESAERNLLSEWFKSGYKAEIESAMWRFSTTVPVADWQAWSQANAQFESNMIPYAQHVNLPVTRLFPPPASWSTVSMWYRGRSQDASGAGEYRFQYARVQIARPWMDIQALLTGALKLDRDVGQSFVVSDGVQADHDNVPRGALGAYIEELVLVRGISYSGQIAEHQDEHPLANYAYPDAINLLGYIVRTLPEIPSKRQLDRSEAQVTESAD